MRIIPDPTRSLSWTGILLSVLACGDTPTTVPKEASFAVVPAAAGTETMAYVANVHSADLSVIAVGSDSVVATIRLAGAPAIPGGVAVSADGTNVYVTNRAGQLWVVDAATRTVSATIPLNGTDVRDVALSPDGLRAFAVQRNDDNVAVIDLVAKMQVATIPVGRLPTRIVASPDGRFAYVANFLSNSVSVIDLSTETVLANLGVGVFPNDLAVSKSGRRVYSANWGSNTVSAIAVPAPGGSIPWVYAAWPAGQGAWTVDLSPDDSTLYVGNWHVSRKGLTKLRTSSGLMVDHISLGVEQTNIGVTPDGGRIYLTDFSGSGGNGSSVQVVDPFTGTLLKTLTVGEAPYGMAFGTRALGPTSTDDCKDGRWQAYGFRNQGLCIQFVNTGRDSR